MKTECRSERTPTSSSRVRRGRALAYLLGFAATDVVLITTAISELARNIMLYARDGEITLGRTNGKDPEDHRGGARRGPESPTSSWRCRAAIPRPEAWDSGLPGVRRLMDEVTVDSTVGKGTTVVAKKWKR